MKKEEGGQTNLGHNSHPTDQAPTTPHLPKTKRRIREVHLYSAGDSWEIVTEQIPRIPPKEIPRFTTPFMSAVVVFGEDHRH